MQLELRNIGEFWRRRRYAVLFVSLVITIGVSPAFETRAPVLSAFVALNLVAAVLGTVGDRGFRYLLGFGAVALALMIADALSQEHPLLNARDISWIVVVLMATVSTLRTALRRGPVDSERLLAAISVYLLLGITFAVGYALIDKLNPGSFAEGGRALPVFGLGSAIYFSFLTIATVGFGDIVPVNRLARGVAVIEAVGGQLYMVVLVARLVSLWGR